VGRTLNVTRFRRKCQHYNPKVPPTKNFCHVDIGLGNLSEDMVRMVSTSMVSIHSVSDTRFGGPLTKDVPVLLNPLLRFFNTTTFCRKAGVSISQKQELAQVLEHIQLSCLKSACAASEATRQVLAFQSLLVVQVHHKVIHA